MKRLLLAFLLLAGCQPAAVTPSGSLPSSPAAPSTTPSASPSAAAGSPAPAPTPTTVASAPQQTSALTWPRLADLPAPTPIKQARLWGRSKSDLFAVIGTPELWHYDGTSWTSQAVSGAGNLIGLTGSNTSVFASTDSGAIVTVPTGGAPSVRTGVSTAAIPAVAYADDSTLLAASTDGVTPVLVVGKNGIGGQIFNKEKGYGVIARNGQYVVVGQDGFMAYKAANDTNWQTKDGAPNGPLRAVAAYTGGSSPLDVMAIGDAGASVREAGGTFLPYGTTAAKTPLNDIGAASAAGVFAVGNSGLILFFSSDAWRPIVQEASIGDILAMTALGDREIIILTSKGLVQAGPYTQYI